jgi:hypothetical protein
LTEAQVRNAAVLENDRLRFLNTDGPNVLRDYIDHMRLCDAIPGATTMADRIQAWSAFQAREVRDAPGHHMVRVPTPDGIENDDFGTWARATAISLKGAGWLNFACWR